MDYLSREAAPFGDALWEQIDTTIVETLKKYLVGRRFLPLYGPLGPGAQSVAVDSSDKDESFEDGVVQTTGRKFVELYSCTKIFRYSGETWKPAREPACQWIFPQRPARHRPAQRLRIS